MEVFDPATRAFSYLGEMLTPRYEPMAETLADGRVLIAGGTTGTLDAFSVTASAELFDPATNRTTATGSLNEVRVAGAMVRLANGRVLVAGGQGVDTAQHQVLKSAELYDPTTGHFEPTGSMHHARWCPMVALLRDGRVLFAGGLESGKGITDSAEIYDPATGVFSEVGTLTIPREAGTATVLDDGLVLIAGGLSGSSSAVDSAELFDPSTGRFSPLAAKLPVAMSGWAARLPDGRILIADDIGSIYDPATERFSPAITLGNGIPLASSVILSGGQILAIGESAALYLP